jgi:hypothetical protein
MAIDITALFTNLGKVFYTHEISETHVQSLPTQFAAIETAYETTGDLDLITNVPNIQNSYTKNSENLANSLATIANNTIINVVNADTPQPNTEFLTAYDELVNQMIVAGDTVKKNTITGSITANTNVGDGIFNHSLKNTNGTINENIFGERVVINCTADAQTGGLTIGNELFAAQGEYSISNPLSALWPNKGSGSNNSLYAISALGDNSNGNILTNSNFLSDSTGWTLTTCSIDNSVTPYYGLNTLHATGNGNATQTFDSSTGTSGNLTPNAQYSCAYWAKGTGTVTVSLTNGTSAIADDAGTSNSTAVAIASDTTWVYQTTSFITPAIIPAITQLKIAFTSVTGSIAVDYVSLGLMTELYPYGPSLAIHSGASQFYLDDGATFTTTNDHVGEFQTCFNRFFNLREQSRQLPSADSGSETIADTLIG